MGALLPKRLIDLAGLVAQTDRPDDAAQSVVNHVAKAVDSADVSLWLLERGDSNFIPHASIDGRWSRHQIAVSALSLPSGVFASTTRITAALRRSNPTDRRQPSRPLDGTLVVGHRGETMIGFLMIADIAKEKLSKEQEAELELCAQLLVQIYQREFAYNHLKASQTPVTFHGSEKELFESLILQIAESARMEFVALREYRKDLGGLRTLEVWGFHPDLELDQFDLIPVEDYPPFKQALDGFPVIAPTMDAPEFVSLTARDELEPVRSFVALPIRVGEDIFGVLSVAASCEYEYNTLERRAFEGLANAAGLAILYHRSNHEVTNQALEYTEISTALTAVEVAQASRHEAIVKVGNASLAINNIKKAIGADKPSVAIKRLDGLKQDVKDVIAAVNKISLALTPEASELREMSLRELWDEAKSATAGKLSRAQVNISGTDAKVWVYPDRIRQVFINLLLNSADAFAESSSSEAPEVVVRLEKRSRPLVPFVFTYRDNAGGLKSHRLKVGETPAQEPQTPAERLVFKKGVTSKPDGTGYGLWLADRFMQQHSGSISVIEEREGMMFKLELPDPSTVEEGEDGLRMR